MGVVALVPAAGAGLRLGGQTPKGLRTLRGEPLLVHALHSVCACADVTALVLAVPAVETERVEELLRGSSLRPRWRVVAGGVSRQDSVAAALTAADDGDDVVLVHDAARALVPAEVVCRVVEAVCSGAEAVVPVLAVADTLKQVEGAVVTATLDRSSVRQVQTPQGFRRDVLVRAYSSAPDHPATDDAALVEQLGVPVHVVAGHPEAFKITTPLDLLLAEAVLQDRLD